MRPPSLSRAAAWLVTLAALAAGSGACSGGEGSPVGGSGAGGHATTTGSGGGGGACVDTCPAPGGGIEVGCTSRFLYGLNYAWGNFAGDFGGIPQWSQPGVSGAAEDHATKLADMRAHGADVVRWWVFPDFRGAGVTFDASGAPMGLSAAAIADLGAALDLAEEADVHVMLCLFSFDGFRPAQSVPGIWVPSLAPIVADDAARGMLLANVVRPLAQAVAASPHRDRLVAWDVINEPEWAITGPSPYGDDDYAPNADLTPVSHAQMETFVADVIGVLRQESAAKITVGGAAVKWAKAWSHVGVDFYTFHIYDWINTYWPYDMSPAGFGVTDKPVVMGEFPVSGLTGVSYADMLNSWYTNGYAGALGWQYTEATPADLAAVKAFADAHACETRL